MLTQAAQRAIVDTLRYLRSAPGLRELQVFKDRARAAYEARAAERRRIKDPVQRRRADLREMFDSYDLDSSGLIDLEEFKLLGKVCVCVCATVCVHARAAGAPSLTLLHAQDLGLGMTEAELRVRAARPGPVALLLVLTRRHAATACHGRHGHGPKWRHRL